MTECRSLRCRTGIAWLVASGILFSVASSAAAGEVAGAPAALAGSQVPKGKQTKLALYVTAAQVYEMWRDSPETVKVIDVRTPEEFAFVGHPEMAWNIPLAFVTYERKDGKFSYGHAQNPSFVEQVREIARPTDTLLLTCGSGGRGAIAVNKLAAAGFTNADNIVNGIEGDLVEDRESVFYGKRMKNGWKNSAPWIYGIDPEKIILEEGSLEGFVEEE